MWKSMVVPGNVRHVKKYSHQDTRQLTIWRIMHCKMFVVELHVFSNGIPVNKTMLVILPFTLTFYWLLVHWKLRLKLNKHFWISKYLDGKEALDHAVVSQMQRIAGVWQCLTCGWETKFKTRLFEHVEATHVQTNGYTCPYCDKFCPSKNSLKVHKSRNHKNEITNMYWILQLHWIKVALGFEFTSDITFRFLCTTL